MFTVSSSQFYSKLQILDTNINEAFGDHLQKQKSIHHRGDK